MKSKKLTYEELEENRNELYILCLIFLFLSALITGVLIYVFYENHNLQGQLQESQCILWQKIHDERGCNNVENHPSESCYHTLKIVYEQCRGILK